MDCQETRRRKGVRDGDEKEKVEGREGKEGRKAGVFFLRKTKARELDGGGGGGIEQVAMWGWIWKKEIKTVSMRRAEQKKDGKTERRRERGVRANGGGQDRKKEERPENDDDKERAGGHTKGVQCQKRASSRWGPLFLLHALFAKVLVAFSLPSSFLIPSFLPLFPSLLPALYAVLPLFFSTYFAAFTVPCAFVILSTETRTQATPAPPPLSFDLVYLQKGFKKVLPAIEHETRSCARNIISPPASPRPLRRL